MRAAEVQFSEIKLIWSLKYILGRWDGGRWVGGRWTVGRWTVIGGTVDGAFGIRRFSSQKVFSVLLNFAGRRDF